MKLKKEKLEKIEKLLHEQIIDYLQKEILYRFFYLCINFISYYIKCRLQYERDLNL